MPVAIKNADFRYAAHIVGSIGLQSVERQIAEAIATERERCALIAEQIAQANLVNEEATTGSSVAQTIANMIRK